MFRDIDFSQTDELVSLDILQRLNVVGDFFSTILLLKIIREDEFKRAGHIAQRYLNNR